MNRRQRAQVGADFHDVAGPLPAIGGRREERELHGPAERERERAAVQVHGLAFLVAARQQAHGAGWGVVGFRRQPDVEGARRAAADAASQPAPDQPVPGGAARDRALERVVLQQAQRWRLRPPCGDDFDKTFGNQRRVEDAAVQQNRVGTRQGGRQRVDG